MISRRLRVLTASLLALTFTVSARAETYTWNGTAGSDWFAAATEAAEAEFLEAAAVSQSFTTTWVRKVCGSRRPAALATHRFDSAFRVQPEFPVAATVAGRGWSDRGFKHGLPEMYGLIQHKPLVPMGQHKACLFSGRELG